VGLYLPPSKTIDNFTGGYKAASDFTDLADTETSDAQNCVYTEGSDLDQRAGSLKLNTTSLSATITGHYFFRKLTTQVDSHVVAATGTLFNYNSSTAIAIRTGLSGTSENYWQFVQIQDPRSASDDIVIGTNGVDPVTFWNGSASAANLSAISTSSGVAVAKYILSHKNRVYLANITDSADVDSPVKVLISGFGTDGAPDPHVFGDSIFVGGSDRSGQIQGMEVQNDQIIFYREKDIWKFTPGGGVILDTASLFQAKEQVGLLAPRSLIDVGDFHIFLSSRGVFAFDGNNLTHLSKKVDEDILRNSNKARLKFAQAEYNKDKNQYIIYYPASGSSRNNKALIYDIRLGIWQPPVTGRRVSVISNFQDSDDRDRIIYGDYTGLLYEDDRGTNDGISTGFNGTVDSTTVNTFTDSSQMFNTDNDGLAGLVVRITDGLGLNEEKVIASNTSATVTLDADWNIVPNSASTYTIAGIDSAWRSKDFDFGGHDIVKLFRYLRLRLREEGAFDLCLRYFVDFKSLGRATKNAVSLLAGGMVWSVSNWDEVEWDGLQTITKKIPMKSTILQSTQGQHIAISLTNRNANEGWKLRGFDIEVKGIGKR